MGRGRFSNTAYRSYADQATDGGKHSATHDAEQTVRQGGTWDPLVDPKGLEHLGFGPVRGSRFRFEQQSDGTWLLPNGPSMSVTSILDTTASMANNVDLAFASLPEDYRLMTEGPSAVLRRYDTQFQNISFGDVDDSTRDEQCLSVSQFEMDVKIAQQLALLIPSRDGGGNSKEDGQLGLFAAAYLVQAHINRYGLKRYVFYVSDEVIGGYALPKWLRRFYGNDYLTHVNNNGWNLDPEQQLSLEQIVLDLQKQAHAFRLHVPTHGDNRRAVDQAVRVFGASNVVVLPEIDRAYTSKLHLVKATIIGLTEGTLDLESAPSFLLENGLKLTDANKIMAAVSHIPLRAQEMLPNFEDLPKEGDVFKNKTDVWPMEAGEVAHSTTAGSDSNKAGWL